MNDYQKRQKADADKLANELKNLNFIIRVEKNDDSINDYNIILTDNKKDYKVSRDYNGIIQLYSLPYVRLNNISSHKSSEVHKEIFTSNKVKVMTEKKLRIKCMQKDKNGEVPIMEVFALLERQVKKQDLEVVELAKQVVDNIDQDEQTKYLAIQVVNNLGYKDYVHFLDLLDANYTEVKIADEYIKQLTA